MANERRLIYADSGEVLVSFMEKHLITGNSDFLKGYMAGLRGMADSLLETPPVDAVEVDTIAEMLAYVHGDECACNFGCHDEWLPMVCDYAETECPHPKEPHGCWKQFIKHWGERIENGET